MAALAASIPETVPHDRLLDFAVRLRDAIRGRTMDRGSVEQVNRALVELFDCFCIYPPGHWAPEQVSRWRAGAVLVEPSIRPEVAERFLDAADWPEPPIEWVEALSADAQGYADKRTGDADRRVGLALRAIQVPTSHLGRRRLACAGVPGVSADVLQSEWKEALADAGLATTDVVLWPF